jgi:adenylate cyclase
MEPAHRETFTGEAAATGSAYSAHMTDEGMSVDEIRGWLTGEHPGLMDQRRRFQRFPASPRCKMCMAPFAGPGGLVFRVAGFGRFAGNPSICRMCITQMRKRGLSGVEIPLSLLFSDVRGSTAMGERMRPSEFHAFLHHFYRLASDAILEHDGLVDKIVGDEVIGLFFGGVSGPQHPAAAVAAAIDLAERAARPDATASGPIPAGTAVHSGDAFVGPTGPEGAVDDFTALGDAVNTTARLASAAGAGEVIVSLAAAEAAGTAIDGLEHRTVDIRGRTEPIEVVVLVSGGRIPAAA